MAAAAQASEGGSDPQWAPAEDPWPAVDRLFDAYADALMRAESLPVLGRTQVVIGEREGHRMVSRPIARRFVQGHARAQLDQLATLLGRYALRTGHAGAAQERLARIESAREVLTGWGPVVERVRRHPLAASVFVALDLAVLGQAGTDLTSPGALLAAAGEGLEAAGSLGAFLRLLGILLILAIEVAILVVPLLVWLGFRPKRAIFHGGRTRESRRTGGPLEDARWKDLGGTDVYEAERQAFAALGTRGRGERHLDLVADFGMLAVGLSAVYAGVFSYASWAADGRVPWVSALIAVGLGYVFVNEVRANWAVYRDRRRRSTSRARS